MKKQILIFAVALAALTVSATGCNSNKKVDLKEAEAALEAELDAMLADSTLNDDQKYEAWIGTVEKYYNEHKEDSLGLELFRALVTNWEPEKSIKAFESTSDLIKSDPLILTKIEGCKNAINAVAGKPYTDFEVEDIKTGEKVALSSILAKGKPVLIDFWASWCGPCRRCISSHLIDFAKSGKATVIGVAVWENSIEDTKKAVEALKIDYPVFYNEEKTNPVAQKYGVNAIPTLILVSTDGTILVNSHDFEDVEAYFKSK